MTAAACSRCGAPLPVQTLGVQDVAVVLASTPDEREGLLGWAQLRVGPFHLAGLAVRLNSAGEIVVTFPARKDRRGTLHRLVTAVDPALDRAIRAAVISAYAEQRSKAGREGSR